MNKYFIYKVRPEFIVSHLFTDTEEFNSIVKQHTDLIKSAGIKEYLDNIHGIGYKTMLEYFTKLNNFVRPIKGLEIL